MSKVIVSLCRLCGATEPCWQHTPIELQELSGETARYPGLPALLQKLINNQIAQQQLIESMRARLDEHEQAHEKL